MKKSTSVNTKHVLTMALFTCLVANTGMFLNSGDDDKWNVTHLSSLIDDLKSEAKSDPAKARVSIEASELDGATKDSLIELTYAYEDAATAKLQNEIKKARADIEIEKKRIELAEEKRKDQEEDRRARAEEAAEKKRERKLAKLRETAEDEDEEDRVRRRALKKIRELDRSEFNDIVRGGRRGSPFQYQQGNPLMARMNPLMAGPMHPAMMGMGSQSIFGHHGMCPSPVGIHMGNPGGCMSHRLFPPRTYANGFSLVGRPGGPPMRGLNQQLRPRVPTRTQFAGTPTLGRPPVAMPFGQQPRRTAVR